MKRRTGPPPFKYRKAKRPLKQVEEPILVRVPLTRPPYACVKRDGTPKSDYPTWAEANEAAMRRGHPDLGAYACPNGHGWHIGKGVLPPHNRP